ncbi:MAG TPA: RNA 2',3'-cyclic phosphodiesterase [bacterium]|nr:RNA 2',3'-cyclic phosphodiesterase [bacterium]
MAKIRTFIAVEIPPGIKTKVAELQSELKQYGDKVNWVKPRGLHLTLKFLGATEESLLDKIISQLNAATTGTSPFQIKLEGLGAFPNLKRPRVLWCGVTDGASGLSILASSIDRRLNTLGFAEENRPYSAHLTICRIKRWQGLEELLEQVEKNQDFVAGAFMVSEIQLIKSELTSQGAIHTPIQKVPLQ